MFKWLADMLVKTPVQSSCSCCEGKKQRLQKMQEAILSGDIESEPQSTEDVVMTCDTPEHLQNRMEEWQKRIRETANLGEVIIGKQRHGPTGTVKLFWNGEFAQFGNLVKEEYLPDQIG